MPTFMKQGLHIIADAYRIHKNKRALNHRVAGAKSARGFILAVFQIQQIFLHHRIKSVLQSRIHLLENGRTTRLELFHVLKRAQRRLTGIVHIQVPGPQRFEPQFLAAAFIDAHRSRNHHLFNRRVEAVSIFRRVIETLHFLPTVGPVARSPSIFCQLAAQIQKLPPNPVDRLAVIQLAVRHQPPGLLTDYSVRILEDGAHLADRTLLTIPGNRLSTGDFVIIRLSLVFLGQHRQIFFPEKIGIGAHIAQGDRISLRF